MVTMLPLMLFLSPPCPTFIASRNNASASASSLMTAERFRHLFPHLFLAAVQQFPVIFFLGNWSERWLGFSPIFFAKSFLTLSQKSTVIFLEKICVIASTNRGAVFSEKIPSNGSFRPAEVFSDNFAEASTVQTK